MTASMIPASSRDDPRVRGGTRSSIAAAISVTGRSPRARGNPRPQALRYAATGTIPACAGEPGRLRPHDPLARDDPRVRGGTWVTSSTSHWWMGRSPRVRGNLVTVRRDLLPPGTIPACAGEPELASSMGSWLRDDPRVCGGTEAPGLAPGFGKGRSPRVRGNLESPDVAIRRPGTIPACAGEPLASSSHPRATGDDPRACGGTARTDRCARAPWGRSPRVRGNLANILVSFGTIGTIPACAGEPRARR